MRGGGGCGVSANEYSSAHGAQINFGDLTPYLNDSNSPTRGLRTESGVVRSGGGGGRGAPGQNNNRENLSYSQTGKPRKKHKSRKPKRQKLLKRPENSWSAYKLREKKTWINLFVSPLALRWKPPRESQTLCRLASSWNRPTVGPLSGWDRASVSAAFSPMKSKASGRKIMSAPFLAAPSIKRSACTMLPWNGLHRTLDAIFLSELTHINFQGYGPDLNFIRYVSHTYSLRHLHKYKFFYNTKSITYLRIRPQLFVK